MTHPRISTQIIGQTPLMQALFADMALAAAENTPLLIQGQPGVGKERVAQAIHTASARQPYPWVVVHCGAVPSAQLGPLLLGTTENPRPEGKLAQARQGSIFLDEIEALSPALQSQLLDYIHTCPVDTDHETKTSPRLIVSTHRSLAQQVAGGFFREDLFATLAAHTLTVPPLSARRDDIPLLAAYFIEKFCGLENVPAKTLTAAALQTLTSFSWPGNVRQLAHTLHRAVVNTESTRVDASDLALHQPVAPTASFNNHLQNLLHPPQQLLSLADVEDAHIRRVIDACQGNMTHAARILNIGRATLYRKLKHTGWVAPRPVADNTEVIL